MLPRPPLLPHPRFPLPSARLSAQGAMFHVGQPGKDISSRQSNYGIRLGWRARWALGSSGLD